MNETRFQELADAYGGDLARWPAEVRDAARAYRAAAPEAAARVLAAAAALDHALARAPEQPVHAAVLARVLASAPDGRAAGGWRRVLAPGGWAPEAWGVGGTIALVRRPATAMFAAIVLLGFAAGWMSGRAVLDADPGSAFLSASYDGASYFELEGAEG